MLPRRYQRDGTAPLLLCVCFSATLGVFCLGRRLLVESSCGRWSLVTSNDWSAVVAFVRQQSLLAGQSFGTNAAGGTTLPGGDLLSARQRGGPQSLRRLLQCKVMQEDDRPRRRSVAHVNSVSPDGSPRVVNHLDSISINYNRETTLVVKHATPYVSKRVCEPMQRGFAGRTQL